MPLFGAYVAAWFGTCMIGEIRLECVVCCMWKSQLLCFTQSFPQRSGRLYHTH